MSVSISLRLNGAISPSAPLVSAFRGRHSLRHQSITDFVAIALTRCPTSAQMPNPAMAIAMAIAPLISIEKKVIVESSAKRNSRIIRVF